MSPDERDAACLWDMLQAAKEVVEITAGVSLGTSSITGCSCAQLKEALRSSAKPREGCLRRMSPHMRKYFGDRIFAVPPSALWRT
jgi:hypothetical protein